MNSGMSNNDAEKHGEDILKKGAGIIDEIRGNKRGWSKSQTTGNQMTQDRRNLSMDKNTKRRKFMKPNY